jgi:hypothetical protein
MKWREFSKRLLLADGSIDEAEARLIKRAILEDKVVDQDEVEFLLELKRDAKAVHPEFTRFLYAILKKAILKDGVISGGEVAWLRKLIFANLFAGPLEREFLTELAREAKRVDPEFHQLLADAGGPKR